MWLQPVQSRFGCLGIKTYIDAQGSVHYNVESGFMLSGEPGNNHMENA